MSLAEIIAAADGRAGYDSSVKKLLSHKVILAWILKCCTKEFSPYNIEYIMNECIERSPDISTGKNASILPPDRISRQAVHQDVPNREEKIAYRHASEVALPVIQGINTEDKSINEGAVYYDIRFLACLPGDRPQEECLHSSTGRDRSLPVIQLIINLEIQQNTNPGYPLVKRGFYYCSRLISAQRGTVFEGDQYEKLRKVYSIWICPSPPKKAENVIQRYRTAEELLCEGLLELPNGKEISLPPETYDLMEVVILNLSDNGKNIKGDRSGNGLLRLLRVLLSDDLPPEDKKSILRDEYNIVMTEDFESEVQNMCNLSERVWEKGHESGVIEGRMDAYLHAIRRIQEHLKLTAEQAMDILGIPTEDRNAYLNT